MTTEPRRTALSGLTVRTRIAVSVAVLTGLALAGAGLVVYALESARIERGVSEQVQQELAEFATLRDEGIDPDARPVRGFTDVRTEEIPVRFSVPDADGYMSLIADTAGPVALALRLLPAPEWAAVKADVASAFPQFAVADRFELPGLALCAVAS